MDTSEIIMDTLPETWELQSFRKSFKGRTVDVLPEAWELRNFPKPTKGSSPYKKCHKRNTHDGDDSHMKIIMLLAIRCLQCNEILDFSIDYGNDEYGSIILKYKTEDDLNSREKLRLLIKYAPKDVESKRLFKNEISEMVLHALPSSYRFKNVVLYTNMHWKQKSQLLEKINFEPERIDDHSELIRLGIIGECYSLADLRKRIEGEYPRDMQYFLTEDAFSRFVIATEQPSEENITSEIRKYLQKEYKLSLRRSLELEIFLYKYFYETLPWWRLEEKLAKQKSKKKKEKLYDNTFIPTKILKLMTVEQRTVLTKQSFSLVLDGLLAV